MVHVQKRKSEILNEEDTGFNDTCTQWVKTMIEAEWCMKYFLQVTF